MMITDKRMEKLIDRAHVAAIDAPDGHYSQVFACVLGHLVNNEQPPWSPMTNLTATGARMRLPKKVAGKRKTR